MRYCFSCKYLSPRQAIYCAHCGGSFGGRRCPQHHLSPADAKVCIQCGTNELTQPSSSFSISGVVQVAMVLLVGIVAAVAAPPLFRALSSGASTAWSRIFSIAMLDRVLAFVLVSSLLLRLLPGELGRVVRRNAARLLDMLLKSFLYFLAGIPQLIASLINAIARRR